MQAQIDRLQVAIGRLELAARLNDGGDFNAHELGVFSQWGEDGLIAYLISRVPIARPWFVEFGVEDYREANTRFLVATRDWRGLVIDGSAAHVRSIESDDISWRHDLTARHAFVTRDNINKLLEQAGFTGDIGLLSIDIDGNDYWVWQAIDVISPRIVVAEYNSLWGADRAVTVSYDPSFVRGEKHFSNLYYGASIAALARLGKVKGYSLVGGNKAGNNAFFVRDDVLGALPVVGPSAAYRRAGFREARSDSGVLTFADFAERKRVVGHLTVFDVDLGREVSIASLGSP
ncbi:MAG TPA: hypothetical protein VH143_06380 [Kofleriaceae bacterium]|jgi:hypothetical protein|nr:hypothetical protein [Kofleriaceae bacterium]